MKQKTVREVLKGLVNHITDKECNCLWCRDGGIFSQAEAKIREILPERNLQQMTKAEAILRAIRDTGVGHNIIIHNEDGSIFCTLKVIVKKHPEGHEEAKKQMPQVKA